MLTQIILNLKLIPFFLALLVLAYIIELITARNDTNDAVKEVAPNGFIGYTETPHKPEAPLVTKP